MRQEKSMRSHKNLFRSGSVSRRAFAVGVAAVAATDLAGRHAGAQTPVPAAGIDFVERIGPLLAAAPAREFDDASPIAFYYADLAGQLASTGVERPDPAMQPSELPEGFYEASVAVPLASRAFQSGLDPEWFSTFGFNPFATGQVLEVSDAPSVVSIFSGGFDREVVEAALEESGYAMVLQETGGAYWSFGDDLAPDTPVGRLGVGAMNYAFVTGELLVFTARETDVQDVSQVLAGHEPSMLDQGVWVGMCEHFSSDTVGMIPLAPGVLQRGAAPASPQATPVHEEDGGDVEYLAFGVRAGARAAPLALVGEGTPAATPASDQGHISARVEVRIRYGSETLAEREAEVIPERWESSTSRLTSQPYPELMTLENARVSERDPLVVAVDFTSEAPNEWTRMVHTQDLMPFVPTVG